MTASSLQTAFHELKQSQRAEEAVDTILRNATDGLRESQSKCEESALYRFKDQRALKFDLSSRGDFKNIFDQAAEV